MRRSQTAVLGDGSRDLVAHACRARLGVRVAARVRRGGAGAARGALAGDRPAHRRALSLPRARPLRRLRRDVGPAVQLVRDARRAPLGHRLLLDPPSRPGARVRQAGPRGPVGDRALPEEQQAIEAALARRDARRDKRARRLPRARGHLHRGGAAGVRAVRAGRGGAIPVDLRDGHGRPRKATDLAIVPIENHWRARSRPRSTRSRARPATCDRGRGRAADPPLPDRARRARRSRSSASSPTPRRHRSAPASCARHLPGAERVASGSTAEAVRTVVESDEPWAAIASELAAEMYDAKVLAAGIEDEAGNETRFVWLAPEGYDRALGRSDARPRSSSAASTTSRPARSSTSYRALLARHQPDEDRVAAAPCRRPRPLSLLRGPRRRGRRSARRRSPHRARHARARDEGSGLVSGEPRLSAQ